ncbi:MAG: tRNA threonylcarbamoyladenosine dehydratase [Burkholderiaceae bacterium]
MNAPAQILEPLALDAQAPDLARRFGGMVRLYGAQGAARIATAHVCVVGVGGVGSWATECLARSGVGKLTLIDLDHVAESNINRQVHALTPTLGMAKVAALAQRIGDINPQCAVHQIEEFITPENVASLMPQCDAVIDCIDQVRAKVALAAWCKAQNIRLMMCGAAGGKRQAARIRLADLAQTTHDPLLAKVRSGLRRDHGFAAVGRAMGVTTVYSDEPMVTADLSADPQGLSCAGYGSAMHITAAMGLMAAGEILNFLAGDKQ